VNDYKLFVCVQCGFEYDEEKGWPTTDCTSAPWDEIPEDWSCRTAAASRTSRWSRLPAVTISVARMPEPIRGAPTGGGSAHRVPVRRGVAGPAASLDPRWHAGHAGDPGLGRRSRCRTSQGGGISRQTIYTSWDRARGLGGTRCDWPNRLVDAVAEAIEGNVATSTSLPGGFRAFSWNRRPIRSSSHC